MSYEEMIESINNSAVITESQCNFCDEVSCKGCIFNSARKERDGFNE
jgi:hypothetical protein